ncbi:hypothetical protein AAHE18_14G234500 [Arachis hypogaea]
MYYHIQSTINHFHSRRSFRTPCRYIFQIQKIVTPFIQNLRLNYRAILLYLLHPIRQVYHLSRNVAAHQLSRRVATAWRNGTIRSTSFQTTMQHAPQSTTPIHLCLCNIHVESTRPHN